jgi:tetratricopeptide (TPR) repeat protein
MIRSLPAVLALFVAASLTSAPYALAQLPPLGGQTATPPPAQPAGIPPLAGTTAPPTGLRTETMNADLKTARAANQEKRFADAETLMLKDTAAKPGEPYLWIELGLAQLGEKKYPEAEASFKSALNGPAASPEGKTPSGSFYTADGRTAGHVAIATVAATADPKSKGEIEGISNASLGEIYIKTNRIPDAQAAFDKAAAANPSQAGLYYGNETVFLFQAGNAAAQLATANKAIAADPARPRNYYFKAQALTTQATVDPKTSKLILPPGCLEAYQKYLELEPIGQFAPDTKAILTAAGASMKPVFKK